MFIRVIIQQSLSILKTAENQQWKIDLFNDRNLINGNKLRAYRCFQSSLRQRLCKDKHIQDMNVAYYYHQKCIAFLILSMFTEPVRRMFLPVLKIS